MSYQDFVFPDPMPLTAPLDVVKRDVDFCLFHGVSPLTSPGGVEVAHADPRVVEHIRRELAVARVADLRAPGGFAVFCLAAEAGESGLSGGELAEGLGSDPLLARREIRISAEEWEGRELSLDFAVSGMAGVASRINDLLMRYSGASPADLLSSAPEACQVLGRVYAALPAPRRAAVHVLGREHGVGLALPLLVAAGAATPSEYAGAALSPRLAANCGGDCEARFVRLRAEAGAVAEFLTYFRGPESERGLAEIIARGESARLEFKSTFRVNLHTGKRDPDISHAALKTLDAFLNSGGGTLLIGVRDDGSIQGIETDAFQNLDLFQLHFFKTIESAMGKGATPFIKARFHKAGELTVFEARCEASPRPVFLSFKNFGEEFYIRMGGASARLNISEALSYIAHRFQES